MTNVSAPQRNAHKALADNRIEAMREQARDYLRLAALTTIPALAQEFRAKTHALYAQATLAEQAVGPPIYFELA